MRPNPLTLIRAIVSLTVLLASPQARAGDEAPPGGAVWRHRPGNSQPGELRFYPNGKINNPAGRDTWTFTGRTLEMRWANPQAPGGFWIDTCTLADDAETYTGTNQQNMPIVGWRVNRPAEATLSPDDPRAQMKQRPRDPATLLYVRQQIDVLAQTVRPPPPSPAAKRRMPIGGGANPVRVEPAPNITKNASPPKPAVYAATPEQRRQAAANLTAMGPAAVDAYHKLVEVAADPRYPPLQLKSIEALGELGISAGIYPIGRTILLTNNPELARAAADALINLLPTACHRLTLDDAIFLLHVHGVDNPRIALAIEAAWAAKGYTAQSVAAEVEKRRLQAQRDKDYFAAEDARLRALGIPTLTEEEMLARSRERRANMFRGPPQPSPFGGGEVTGSGRSQEEIERERQRKWQEDRDRMRRTE